MEDLPSLPLFAYPFCGMQEVTTHQLKRIRRADARDISRMADQEKYWFPKALQEILKRIDRINNEDPEQAYLASQSALRMVDRIRDASPDLHALTRALYASTLRHNGRPQEALSVYENALKIEGLSKTGISDVLVKMSVTLVCLGQISEAQQAIGAALEEAPTDPVQALAVRSWIRVEAGNLPEALHDSMTVLNRAMQTDAPRFDYSVLSAITVACNVLSFETGLDVDDSIFHRMEKLIDRYRRIYTDSGSGYYKVQRPRLMLSRAEALIFMRTDRPHQAIEPLKRAIRGFRRKYPDDALASALDLVCAYAQTGQTADASQTVCLVRELLEEAHFDIRPLAKNALRAAAETGTVRYGEAVELRSIIRKTPD